MLGCKEYWDLLSDAEIECGSIVVAATFAYNILRA
jgi:hypothetical protein